jgi:hypothetical protein
VLEARADRDAALAGQSRRHVECGGADALAERTTNPARIKAPDPIDADPLHYFVEHDGRAAIVIIEPQAGDGVQVRVRMPATAAGTGSRVRLG